MKPSLLDRVIVCWLDSAMLLWSGCIVILWGWAFDTSGASLLLTLAALLGAVRLCAPVPGRAARGVQRVLAWLGAQDILAMELAAAHGAGATREHRLAMLRMLGGVAVFAACCGALSTAAVYAGSVAADLLARCVLWSPGAWAVLMFVVQLVGLIPLALGLCMLFLAGALLRGGSGRDVFASAFRDWLWALAVAGGAMALLWRSGADVLAVGMATGVLVLATAGGLFARRQVSRRPPQWTHLIPGPSLWKTRVKIAATFTALTVALLAQTRLLADLGGAALGGGLLWTTLSAALLVVALRKSDHKSHPPGEAQIFGAAVGLPGAAILQAAIAVLAGQALAAGERFAAAAMAFLAAAAQVPLSALAAEIVSHQRRGFVVVGGRAREYLAAVAGGACAGVLAYAAGGWLAGGRVLLLTAVAATVAGGVIAALSWAKKIAAQVRWAAWGCVLLCAAVGALLLALRGAAEAMGRASPGVWLSGRAGFDGRPAGVLGGAAPRRSDAITSALRDTFERRPGRWWIVASSCEDIPRPLPESVRAVWSAPDPSAVPPCDWAAMVSDRDGGFLQAAQSARPEAGRQRFEGVLLTPLPADHGRAWRCFNTRALQRCAERLHRGGVFALRTQASGAHAADALAAARSLVEAIGPCWIVVAAEIDGVDLLTVGPMANVAPPQGREGAFVVSSDVLFARYGEVLPIRATAGPTHHGPDGRKLQVWLELGYGVE